MTIQYKRAIDLDEKIHSVKLPYLAWKSLFLIGDQTTLNDVVNVLAENQADIKNALKKLIEAELILESDEPAVVEAEDEFSEEKSSEDALLSALTEENEPEKESEYSEKPVIEILDEEQETPQEMPPLSENLVEDASLESAASEIFETETDEEKKEVLEANEEVDTGENLISFDIDTVFEEKKENDVEVKNADDIQSDDTASAKQNASGGNTILIIDDSIVIRKMVEIALEKENYHLVAATNGREGLSMLDDHNPDLVILDLMLPDIGGIELLKTIKTSKGIPVIMLSGKDSPKMIENAKAEGADEFLPKPFKDEELVEKIKALISQRKS